MLFGWVLFLVLYSDLLVNIFWPTLYKADNHTKEDTIGRQLASAGS